MEPWENYAIVKLIRGVEIQTEVSRDLKKLCDVAKTHFRQIIERIHLDQSRKIAPVGKLIDDIAHLGACNREDTKKAVSIFNEYIIPFLKEEERSNRDLEKRPMKDSTCAFKKDDDKITAPVENEKQIVKTSTRTTQSEYEKRDWISEVGMASSEKKAQKERRDERKMKEHLSEDVLKFQEIFDNHWAEAHDALESDLPEMKIANVLLEIVQRAFTFNRDDALAQLRKAKICAEQIVTDNKIMDEAQGRVGNDIAEELREYRYLQASRALPRARNNFLGNDFKQVMKKYDIAFGGTRKELEAYASKCVEVTWYLCAEDPPVHMILNDAQLFDENLFKTLKMKDAKIDYILWPALKQSENGHVLLKGMAVRKT